MSTNYYIIMVWVKLRNIYSVLKKAFNEKVLLNFSWIIESQSIWILKKIEAQLWTMFTIRLLIFFASFFAMNATAFIFWNLSLILDNSHGHLKTKQIFKSIKEIKGKLWLLHISFPKIFHQNSHSFVIIGSFNLRNFSIFLLIQVKIV